MDPSLNPFFSDCQHRINQYLEASLPRANGTEGGVGTEEYTESKAESLYQAIRYSVLNGGKRIRPVLCYASCYAISGEISTIDPVAASIELIHAYSLIHDDLPAMDNDDLRRGKATCHIAFDEATAILAGDALQALAFQSLGDFPCKNPKTTQALLQSLSKAAGAYGMVAGQAIDIGAVNTHMTLEALQHMHSLKTGALIKSAILMGAIASEQQTVNQLSALSHYGELIGLAFQIQDDVLDVISNTQTLGKNQGADHALNKPTYTSLLGLDKAQKTANQLVLDAKKALSEFDHHADHLRQIADYIVSRTF